MSSDILTMIIGAGILAAFLAVGIAAAISVWAILGLGKDDDDSGS